MARKNSSDGRLEETPRQPEYELIETEGRAAPRRQAPTSEREQVRQELERMLREGEVPW